MIDIKENKESLQRHLLNFYNMVENVRTTQPDRSIAILANDYIDNEISMEQGMKEYYDYLTSVRIYNDRILRAIKSVKGKTFHKHLSNYIKECEPADYCQWEIVRTPVGKEQSVSEFGREIKKEWVTQYAVGDSGDSWQGTICVQIREGKYLKFNFSM